MSRTADYVASEPKMLEESVKALKADIARLQAQRADEGRFLDIKAETTKLARIKDDAAAALLAGKEQAAALKQASDEEIATARELFKKEVVKSTAQTDAEWKKLEKAQDSLKAEWDKLFAAQDEAANLKKDLEITFAQFEIHKKKAVEALAAIKTQLAEVSFE